jgi:hypothetical protein
LGEEDNPDLKDIPEVILENILKSINLSALEGGWSGNGGDFQLEGHNIWFIGNKLIPYCIESSESYPLGLSDLKELVSESVSDWKSFFELYGLEKNGLAKGFKGPRANALSFIDKKNRGLNFNFKEVPCGKEKVKFLFGKENDLIRAYRALATEGALGLALRGNYNHKTYENPGVVWVANFSKESRKIKHMLLHELGHVFGMPHNSVFVMDENIALKMASGSGHGTTFFGRIETDSWRYRFLRDRPLILTSHKGWRKGRRQRNRNQMVCEDDSFLSNEALPRFVLKELGLRRYDCHRISLTMVSKTLERRQQSQTFEMKIREYKTGRTIRLLGSFSPSKGLRRGEKGPGLFTRYLFESRHGNKKYVFGRLTIDKEVSDLPATGSFLLGGKILATKISEFKGTILEIFFPNKNKWWTLKTIHNLQEQEESSGK